MHDLNKFRFWCQKVLPLVYDNSLSYYEVLCKIRDYINNIIDNMNEIAADIDALEERMTKAEGDITAIKQQLEDISQTIVNEVREYLSTPQFITDLINALDGNQDFVDFIVDEITNNEDFYKNLVTNHYFEDYLQANTSVISDVLASMTDYYESLDISAADISTQLASAGVTQSYVALQSGFTAGATYRAYVPSAVYSYTGKAQVTESGGIYTVSIDATQNTWNTYIIDKSNVQNKNIGIKFDATAGDIVYYNIKRGSIASTHDSVSTDTEPNSTLDQTHPAQGTIYQPNKVNNANYMILSVNNATADSIAHVYNRFTWDSLTSQFIVLPLNTAYIVADDLTQVGTISVYIPNNDLAKIILGLLGAENSNTSVNIANLESVTVTNSENIELLKNSVSDGKAQVAQAITDKGVPTSATDSFATMSNNIMNISTASHTWDVVTESSGNIDLWTKYSRTNGESITSFLSNIAADIGAQLDAISTTQFLLYFDGDATNGFYFDTSNTKLQFFINSQVLASPSQTFVWDVSDDYFYDVYILKTYKGVCIYTNSGTQTDVINAFCTDVSNLDNRYWINPAYIFKNGNTTNLFSDFVGYGSVGTTDIAFPTYNNKYLLVTTYIIVNQSFDNPEYLESIMLHISNKSFRSKFAGDDFTGVYFANGSTYKNVFAVFI